MADDDLKALREYATPRGREHIDAIIEHGSIRAAAKVLGLNKSSVGSSVKRAERRAAAKGYAPDCDYTHPQPDGFGVKGVSTMYGPDGEVRAQWVKSQREGMPTPEQLAAAVLEELPASFKGASAAPKRSTTVVEHDLCPVTVIGDHHWGMRSWPEETGEDYNVEIADRSLRTAIDQLTDLAPPSNQALLINVGDYLHFDGAPVTEQSGNLLDADSRYQLVFRRALRATTWAIERMLIRHQTVHGIMAKGNHDPHSGGVLAEVLAHYYANNDRVTIDTEPGRFHYYHFGANLLGCHHGDKVKPRDLPLLMAADQPDLWGKSRYRRWVVGHVHHQRVEEHAGCTVETFGTLAAKDGWHSSMGYRSHRTMSCLVLHREHGEVTRHTVGISQLEEAS